MKNTPAAKRQDPFPFVLRELLSVRPVVKRMFGFTHVYVGERLLFSLRQGAKSPGTNGMWLYTTVEHLESLGREFPDLPRRCLWRSGKKGWVILAARLENFEEYAYTACELILRGDRRIGRVTRGGRAAAEGEGERGKLQKNTAARRLSGAHLRGGEEDSPQRRGGRGGSAED